MNADFQDPIKSNTPFQIRRTSVVARGQGASGQKTSAGLALFREARNGFRRMGRAEWAMQIRNAEFGMEIGILALSFCIPHFGKPGRAMK
jgi:hypothetical protein